MEEKLKERIGFLRDKLVQGIDVDKLVAIIKRDQLLPHDRIAEIDKQTTAGKLDKLVDEIVTAKDGVYSKLLSAVEQTQQCRFMYGVPSNSPAYVHRTPPVLTDSYSTSLTSDSDDDLIRIHKPVMTDTHIKDFSGCRKVTNILTQYGYGHSASSSFPALDRCSPLPVLDDHHTLERLSPLEVQRKHIGSESQYDWFKNQFEGALSELQSLKQQNAEKIGQLSKEAEYFRNIYKKSEALVQQMQDEARSTKELNAELIAAKQHLQETVTQLEKLREEDKHELAELWAQYHKAVASFTGPTAGASNTDGFTDIYDVSLEKYEVLRKEYDKLRERYADLASSHSSVRCQLDAVADVRKQLEDARLERDTALREKRQLQQHRAAVVQKLEEAVRENHEVVSKITCMRHEHENLRQVVAKQIQQLQSDCSKALAERDAAVQEYTQIMSERDTVHKEIEQLQDRLSEMTGLTEKLKTDKLSALQEVEHLQQELAAALAARDKYKLESQSAMEARAQLEAERRELKKEFELVEQQRDIARKERHQALEQMDALIKETYEKTQKEKAEEMDQVAKETEVLKKQIDKMKNELTDAEQEAIVATKRRDWAFSEIDKIVQERESIRTLCDNLRRDRDRAVSELAKALRTSDECEKQKNDAVKELKEVREKYEALAERDARRQQLNSISHNHSRDSAIDADLQEWETETLEIELDAVGGHDFGFELVGGKEDPQFPSDNSLFVSHIIKGGTAEGKLRVNDMLLKINNLDTTNIEHRRAMQELCKHAKALTLVVRRRKSTSTRIWQPLQLLISSQKDSSIQIEQALFISAVLPAGFVAKDGMLPSVGDRLISINHQSTEGLTAREAMKLLDSASQPVVLDVGRQTSPVSSAGSSPTPTIASVLSPLTGHLTPTQQSTAISKPDTPTAGMWDSTSADSTRSGGGSSKNLRSSGSQTDSLDSPGPSPPKALRNHNHDKVRHSMPVLDKAKETVEKIFRSRHKSQDREQVCERDHQHGEDKIPEKEKDKDHHRDRERGHNKREMEEKGREVGVRLVSSVTQTAHLGPDDDGENPALALSKTSPEPWGRSRKREYEENSNSGTWPKSRSGPSINCAVPSTVSVTPAKERPSIKDPFLFEPPKSRDGRGCSGGYSLSHNGMHHVQQNFESTLKCPVTVTAPQPLSSPKSAPHFCVGMIQTPPTASSGSGVRSTSGVRSSFPPKSVHSPTAHHVSSCYPKNSQPNPHPIHPYSHSHPHHRHPPPHVHPVSHSLTQPQSLPSHSGPKYVFPDPRVEPATQHMTAKPAVKPQRPTPTQQRVYHTEKQWLPSSHWFPPHYHVGSPQSYPVHPVSPECAVAARPASLEVPYPIRHGDLPLESLEAKLPSPAGSSVGLGLSGRSSQSSQHQHHIARYSTPPGTFPGISFELDVEKVLCHPTQPSYPSPDRCISPSMSQQSFSVPDRITPTPSEETPLRYARNTTHGSHIRPVSEVEHRYMVFSKHEKLLERIRIPSSSGVTPKSGSVEIVSSPVSPGFRFDPIACPSRRVSQSSCREDYMYSPQHHETRTITFEKSSEPVGFQIQGGPAGGIFVSAVNDNSLASQAGLVIGDQLLEVCGINMRNATHEHAVTVLRQCGDNLTMKVQYNPEKYMDGAEVSSSVSVVSSLAASPARSRKLSSGDSEQSTPKHHTPQLSKSSSSADGIYERPHVVHLKRPKGANGPGFTVVGGNAVGIFVHEISPDSPAFSKLQRGDMILEYNNISFEAITAEQAIHELSKPCSNMRLTIQGNMAKYSKIQNIPGDKVFIRANFSRTAEGEGELTFCKDDILEVESTVYRGTPGLWLAWLVDQYGDKVHRGTIPSRVRLEDELVLRRSHSESWSLGDSEELKASRRVSGSARRSFFRRRRHQRNSSKDSRDLGSFSDASLNSESVPILDESILGYTQVEKIEYDQIRPVVLLAPLAEPLIRKLTSESPDKYKFCEPCIMRAAMTDMEQSLADGRLIDYWKREDHFECVQVSHIRDICDKKIHCLLNTNPRAIERLHRLKIYPIVIFVRHKGSKQIREIRDPQFLPEKLSNKTSKDSFEHFNRVEQEYSHLFSATIQGGNLAEMCMQIKTTISTEQKKAIWVTVSCL